MEINDLPSELLTSVLQYLPVSSLISCITVCQRWHTEILQLSFWKNKFLICSHQKQSDNHEVAQCVLFMRQYPAIIRKVKFQYVDDYEFMFDCIKNCENLVHLEVTMCSVGENLNLKLNNWPQLQTLDLKNSFSKKGGQHLEFSKLKHLTYLRLSHFGLYNESINQLVSCKVLTHIFIERIILSEESLRLLIESKRNLLKSFFFSGGAGVTDSVIVLISQCRFLRCLGIVHCEFLNNDTLKHFLKYPQLDELKLWNNNSWSSELLLKVLSHPSFTKLSKLSLSRIRNITKEIVYMINKNYDQLKFLHYINAQIYLKMMRIIKL